MLAVNNLSGCVRKRVKFHYLKQSGVPIKIERLVAKTVENKVAVCFFNKVQLTTTRMSEQNVLKQYSWNKLE